MKPRAPSLRLVPPNEELRGVAPRALERAARLCSPGDATHRGLLCIGATLARRGLSICAPPGARAPVLAALEVGEAWANGQAGEHVVAKARSDAFNAVIAVERRTIDAVRTAGLSAAKKRTLIDAHAESVVVRYVGLSANYASGAALLVLDGVADPTQLGPVAQQVAGAIAYQSAGLGPARSADVRASACEQAEWEAERQGAPEGHGVGALAVQLFHEYLGSYWKDRSDAQRAYFAEFIEWALA
jgi:hypothetical protein